MQTHPSPTQTDNPGLGDLPSVLKFRQLKLPSIPGYSLSALGRLPAFPGAGNPFAVSVTGPCCLKLNFPPDPEDPRAVSLVLCLCSLPSVAHCQLVLTMAPQLLVLPVVCHWHPGFLPTPCRISVPKGWTYTAGLAATSDPSSGSADTGMRVCWDPLFCLLPSLSFPIPDTSCTLDRLKLYVAVCLTANANHLTCCD